MTETRGCQGLFTAAEGERVSLFVAAAVGHGCPCTPGRCPLLPEESALDEFLDAVEAIRLGR